MQIKILLSFLQVFLQKYLEMSKMVSTFTAVKMLTNENSSKRPKYS